jgi:hypothetical protein
VAFAERGHREKLAQRVPGHEKNSKEFKHEFNIGPPGRRLATVTAATQRARRVNEGRPWTRPGRPQPHPSCSTS